MKIFHNTTDIKEIKHYFDNIKKPFVIKNAVNSRIDVSYLNNYFGDQNITFLNDQSEQENLKLSDFIEKIDSGSKYRLRANTKIGNLIVDHIDTSYIQKIKNTKKRFLDYLLSFGKTSRQHTLFLSTKDCVFAKHAHVTSGLIIQLHESKKWYLSKTRDNFWQVKYKRVIFPTPLYIIDKKINNEDVVTLDPGDMIYIPAYWFHYTTSKNTNISYSHFFTEPMSYYLKNSFLMLAYQSITNSIYSFVLAIQQEPEENIFHKHNLIHKCNKIRNKEKRLEALEYFRSNDFS
jgi:hypothetical protein|tara:strand:+ start:222 stop:1091 length:870 start_codon:yes stop_codon:yes gene_type:complete